MPRSMVPYFLWRDGRPRWEPGPGARRLGMKGRDLKNEQGQWLSRGLAIAAADRLNQELAGRRAGTVPTTPQHSAPERTVAALHEAWLDSPKYARKRASTQRDYRNKARVFVGDFGAEHVAALQHHDLYAWWEELYRERGHAQANGVLAVARLMLSYAVKKGWRSDNPAKSLELETVPPRVVVWTAGECEALVRTADAMGLVECADAIVLALHTGQRQGDVLALELQRVENGRSYFWQSKTGSRVAVPHTDQLAARLDGIRRRRAAPGVVSLATARRIVLRADGGDYTADRLRKEFRLVREAIAGEHPDAPSKWFLDLRDTAITRLALAGCTVAEIRSITGHSLETVHQVLRHYLATDDRMAATAIDKLKAYMAEEGIAV